MQTQKTTIEIPEGMEVDSFNKLSGEVTFKPKPKDFSRIKTIADILADNGITQEEFDKQCEGIEADEQAYRIIKMLAKSLNEGWTPDWNDDSQDKYYPWFEIGGSSGVRCHVFGRWVSASAVGSRLAFKTSNLAEHAGKNFTEVYKQFMLI